MPANTPPSARASRAILAAAVAIALSLPLAATADDIAAVRIDADAAVRADAPVAGVRHDRFIVRYRDGSAEQRDARQLLRSLRQAVAQAGIAGNGDAIAVEHVRRLAAGGDVVRISRPLDAADAAALMRRIAADPAVAHVEPDARLTHTGLPLRAQRDVVPASVPDDEHFAAYQWHLHNATGGIRAPAAWDDATGEGVVVAVLDTGITAHEDLDGNVLAGYDFITDPFVSRRETDERVPGAHDHGDWNDDPVECPVSPSSFHGTHVAGTVAELTDNGIGMAGVAHGAKVLPVRVLGRCGGYLSDIADAIVWSSGGAVDGVPDNVDPAEVINLSLGGGGACAAQSAMQLAIDAALANGTTVVAAAGNQGADAANYTPASCAGVITVGSTRIGGGKAGYSNYGARVDLSAPGGGGGVDGNPNGYVWQNRNDSTTAPELGEQVYSGMSGTSMAAPHVAGVAALVLGIAAEPLAPAQLRTLLKDTVRDFPATFPPGTPIGTGILDAAAAVAAVLPPCEGDDCEPPVDATPIFNRVPVAGLAGAAGDAPLFALEVPVGATDLSFLTYAGRGDVTLLVRFGEEPTADAYDHRSQRPGNNEVVRIRAPQAGTYYVKLLGGEQAFSRLTLEARHQ